MYRSDSSIPAPRCGLGQPDAQQLALVVPVVQGLGRGQALVALQPQQRCVQHGGKGFGGSRLADAGLALQQQRPAERDGQVDRRCGAEVEQVVVRVEAPDHLVDIGERASRSSASTVARLSFLAAILTPTLRRSRVSPSTRIDLITSATMDTAISAGVFAPIGSPTGCAPGRARLGQFEAAQDRRAANPTGHQADVADARVERGPDRLRLGPAEAGDHHRGCPARSSTSPRRAS